MNNPAFARPLQIQAQPPRPLSPDPQDTAARTLVFAPHDQERASTAMQRLNTILPGYGVQIDSLWTP